MLLFMARGLSQEYGGREIFHHVDLEINEGEKVALVGTNGVGKTTLLRILAGYEPSYGGTIKWYQRMGQGVFFPSLHQWENRTVQQILDAGLSGGGAGEAQAMAKRFALTPLLERSYAKLSGGEKTRLGLAYALINNPQLLFLDEPTNHLDLEHLQWLEGLVKDYRGTILLVSHDRTFMDRCVTRIVELTAKGLTSYPGNYTAYQDAKQRKYEADLKAYYDQEKQALKLESAIDEQLQWSRKGYARSKGKARASGNLMGGKEYYRKKAEKLDRRAKSNLKRLERFRQERVARPEETASIHLSFHNESRKGNGLLLGESICKSFGGVPLLRDVRFSVKPGQKIALIGSNGSGKTTLLRMILGVESMDRGDLWRSPALEFGVLDQELQSIQGEKTALETVLLHGSDRRQAQDMLANLLLRGDAVNKPCSALSMGERVRVALAKMLLKSYNLLLMDEPGNYLDLPSREHLEAALRDYRGALILVSHDRTMLEKVCDTVWSIDQKTLRVFPGRFSEYCTSRSSLKSDGIEAERLRLELRLAEIGGLLANTDRRREENTYRELEDEYLAISASIRRIVSRP